MNVIYYQPDGTYLLDGVSHRGHMASRAKLYGWTWARGVGCRGSWGTHDRGTAQLTADMYGLEILPHPAWPEDDPAWADGAHRTWFNSATGDPDAYDRALTAGTVTPPSRCKHPPARLWSWTALDCREPGGAVLCIACCQCGTILKGADTGPERGNKQ